jgi:acyl-coenzyme A synthetase/AMP-(fatty) acid ligase
MSSRDINVTDPIFEWSVQVPYAVAIVEGDQVIHYGALCSAVLHAMAAFREAGWSPGELAGISISGSFALQLVTSLALARAGITQVWLPLSDPVEYRASRAQALGITALITDHEQGLINRIPHFVPDPAWLSASGAGPAAEDLRVSGTDKALIIIQSSGTTGAPKDIVVSQDDELIYANRQHPTSACLPGERCMHLMGLRFWTGLSRALRCLANGGALVVPPAKWTSEELRQFIDRHHVTYLWCTPMHVQILLEGIPSETPRLPQLRFFRCSSGALTVSSFQEARRRISPNLSIQYGSNEAGGIATAPPALLDRYPDCVGFPMPGIELQIVDEFDVAVAAGSMGHVRVRGAGIDPRRMLGTSEETRAYKGEWYYPGDVGLVNPEGVLFLKGRSDEVMNFDGIMIGPAEIESVLGRHPAVADSAAFPLHSPMHQDIPAAAVVLRHPLALDELALYCRQHLGIRAPRMFFATDAIPRSPIGKILRRRLTEIAMEQIDANASPKRGVD